jgi:hypothetical protein
MATQPRFTINGKIDTNRTVLQNLEEICNSSGCWFTFDNYSGRWSVVINQSGTSDKSFDDSNIIGGIRLNGNGLSDLYNSVRVNYPLNDIQDNRDYIEIALPAQEWNANEMQNTLDMQLPLVNNQVQAQLIGFRDLKQSRVSQIIQFDTDYSSIGLRAGQIIDVTNTLLGFASTLFRITEIRESDSPDRGIVLSITALLYDAEVYNESNLSQYILSTANGIITTGDIGTPAQPTVTKYDLDARPRLVISTVVPSGVISAMEFWLATGNSSNTYSLVGTQTNTSGVFLTQGSTVTLDISNQAAANVYVKTRAINSTTTGAYSPVSALVQFQPVQVTDVINNNTQAQDSSGNILNTLGLAGLMGLLNNLIAQINPTASGGIYDRYNTTFSNATGKTLTQAQTAVYSSTTIAGATVLQKLNDQTASSLPYRTYDTATVTGNLITSQFTVTGSWNTLSIDIRTPLLNYVYYFLDTNTANATPTISSRLTSQPALGISLIKGADPGTAVNVASSTVDWNSNFGKIISQNPLPDTYTLAFFAIPTYDLNSNWTTRVNSEQAQALYFYDFQATSGGSSDADLKYAVTLSKT